MQTTLVLPTDAPAIAGPPQGQWTYADWEALPDDGNRYDEQVKVPAYARAGLPEYAIVDPAQRLVQHYGLGAPGRYAGPHVYDAAQHLRFDRLPAIAVPVADLFAGAPDTSL